MEEILSSSSSTNNIEQSYHKFIENYFKFIDILKYSNFDDIKLFIELNSNIIKFHKYYYKYEIYFIHYLFMNQNLNIEIINFFIEKNFCLSYENEANLILFYLFENKLDKNNLVNVIKYLNSKSYNFKKKDSENNNLYHYLIKNKKIDVEIYNLLYSYTNDINEKNNDGNTPILLACQANNLNFIKFLIEKNCDLSLTNDNNNNCLMYTCMNNNYEISELLIDNIDINLEDNQQDTCILYACGCDNYGEINLDLIKLLISKNANYNKVSEDGFSILHYISGVINKKPNLLVLNFLLTLKDLVIDYIDIFNYTFLDYIFQFCNDKVEISNFIRRNLNIFNSNTILKNSIILKNYRLSKELEILKNINIDIGIQELALRNLINDVNLINREKIKNYEPDSKCNICHDDLKSNDICYTCKSNHYFHKECILKWFETPKKNNCPFCFNLINLSNEFII